ncbi:MAG: hypothetical protein K0Q79_1122 [Flavipsychrobacter sp.]|jgi:hypothetical protein|nr:hypothetical protein [Flavipsychrobacter sp.]
MRKLFYLVLFLLFFSCDQEEKSQSNLLRKGSKYSRLLSKFKEITIDTLKIYSPPESKGVEFNGTELDSADAVLFPTEIAEQHFGDPPGLFAIYRFIIDGNKLGLIARTPSVYSASSIKLFFFDIAIDSFTSYIELAESLGDAGAYWEKESWLFKDNSNLRAFVRIFESYDNSVENEGDTTIDVSNYYYLIDISQGKLDTISRDNKELLQMFGQLVK